jgi:hypothetical protein
LLFLLPLPWTGPVITPVMIAVMLVVAGTLLVYLDERGYRIRLRWYDFAVEFFFATLLIIAFCWDWKNIMRLPGETSYSGIPNPFFWSLFLPAYAASVIYFFVRIAQIVRRGS